MKIGPGAASYPSYHCAGVDSSGRDMWSQQPPCRAETCELSIHVFVLLVEWLVYRAPESVRKHGFAP